MRATLEVESCLIKPVVVGNITSEPEETTVGAVGYGSANQANSSANSTLVQAMDKLALQMSQLGESMNRKKYSGLKPTPRPSYTRQVGDQEPASAVICFHFGKEGHYAIGCALRQPPKSQGNYRPPLP